MGTVMYSAQGHTQHKDDGWVPSLDLQTQDQRANQKSWPLSTLGDEKQDRNPQQ